MAAGLPTRCGVGLLELVDGGVVAVAVVAHLGLGHGAAHLGRGTGDGVAAEVDEARPTSGSGRRRHADDATDGRLRLPVVVGGAAMPERRRRSVTSASSGSTDATRAKSSRARGTSRPARRGRPARTTAGGAGHRGCGGCGPRRRWRGPRWPRRASPTSARSSASTSRPSTRTSADGDEARRSFQRASTRRWCPMARWQSMRTGTWLGSPARELAGCVEVPDRLAPPTEAVTDKAVQISCCCGLGHLVDEVPRDAQRFGVAVALIGARRRGEAVGDLSGFGASTAPVISSTTSVGRASSDLATSVRGDGRWCRPGSGCATGRRPGPRGAVGVVGRHAVEDPDLLGPCGRGWPWPDRATSRSLSGPWVLSSPSRRAPLRATLPQPRPAAGSGGGCRSASVGRAGAPCPVRRRAAVVCRAGGPACRSAGLRSAGCLRCSEVSRSACRVRRVVSRVRSLAPGVGASRVRCRACGAVTCSRRRAGHVATGRRARRCAITTCATLGSPAALVAIRRRPGRGLTPVRTPGCRARPTRPARRRRGGNPDAATCAEIPLPCFHLHPIATPAVTLTSHRVSARRGVALETTRPTCLVPARAGELSAFCGRSSRPRRGGRAVAARLSPAGTFDPLTRPFARESAPAPGAVAPFPPPAGRPEPRLDGAAP